MSCAVCLFLPPGIVGYEVSLCALSAAAVDKHPKWIVLSHVLILVRT